MIGFELEIKGQTISAESIEGGVVTLIADVVRGKATMSLGGMAFKENGKQDSVKWFETNLVEGDEFTIRVKDIKKSSVPINVIEVDDY